MDYPRIIAHRCGGALAPENSLAGLAAAARVGCRGVEFDAMLSADGVPVLMHDDTVNRTTGGRGRVDALTAEQLRALDIGGEPVPLLAEALDRCAELGLWANIELKVPTGGDAGRLGTVVGRMLVERWNGRGVVSSFSTAALLAARSQSSWYAVQALLVDAVPANWHELAGRTGVAAIHADAVRIDAATIGDIRRAGLCVACYTVNERVEAERLLAAGASAVFTDHPEHWSRAEM
ncbi:MAG TPA: glycerophosphodiester phosphodiesterase family protein [Rhodocyclaceae bacterium]|nr:glycerophosphodiester phosphodiesterase family protein [Rhodocyclaceae bacterium]